MVHRRYVMKRVLLEFFLLRAISKVFWMVLACFCHSCLWIVVVASVVAQFGIAVSEPNPKGPTHLKRILDPLSTEPSLCEIVWACGYVCPWLASWNDPSNSFTICAGTNMFCQTPANIPY